MSYETLHQRLAGPITQSLSKKLGIKNSHALPRIEKVTVNVGINKSKMDSKETHAYIEDCLLKITGQKPVFTRTSKAISNFKTRTGMVVGCRVTLRGQVMEQFLDRFISYAIPRIRDFRGLPTKLDGQGNYSIGLKDHSIFPEVPPPEARQIFGMQVVITTTAENDEQARALLQEIHMPLKRTKSQEKKETKETNDKVEKEAKTTDTTETSESDSTPNS
jgi:large subunit ribosomal protein L5